MQLTIQSLSKSLNKAYLKEKVGRKDIELFKNELEKLFEKAKPEFSEDTLKDFVVQFLRSVWYEPDHIITVNKERKDFSIHTGKSANDPVAVIAEVKKIGSLEMMKEGKPNVKALHELVLYYLKERITNNNNEIKFLLATDINNWILIDANEFDKKIYSNTKIKKLYEVYVNDNKDNPFFYEELKKILADSEDNFTATIFDLKDYKTIIANEDKKDDKKLVALYKILSPTHFLKLPFANDSNSLDKRFYTELLHIIGLEEIKEGSKKIIQRKKQISEASFLENTIIKLHDKDCLRDLQDVTRFGLTKEEQYYNIALELCITWINRILFLKLLEAQLYLYHQNNKEFLFLNDKLLPDFDELNNLFFQVLAEKNETRRDRLKTKFGKIPYLNSSLFERTELERKTIDISALDNNLPLSLHDNTVLKDDKGKRKQGSLTTLHYLFTFLDSYDFASEGTADIQEENKTLINASVLGLIFEKINGYKDGSFFTPGFITMYMCRETLRRAVIQKFNDGCGWNCTSFEELQDKIEYQDKEQRQKTNNIINSITICDPAVGSGHFLVSALNELISIKYDLKILQYRHNSQRIKEYSIEIVNDELIIQDIESEELFEYTLNQKGNIKPELQYLQETLFHEKEALIENCLFGVDINPNSVKICRLRLWIELLKNSYYTKESNYTELETLPNIDINIKQGNSLISRFDLDSDLSGTLQKSKFTIDSYRIAVQTYRNAQSKEEKRQMEELIDSIKKDFRTDISTYDPINKKLNTLRGKIKKLNVAELFDGDKKKKAEANKELKKLSDEIEKLERKKTEIQFNAIYKEAFEWRFEFPEVLNNDGKFIGFDVVIGNPPYKMVQPNNTSKNELDFFKQRFQFADFKIDLFHLFFQQGNFLLTNRGLLSFIAPSTLLYNFYTDKLRIWLSDNFNINKIVVSKEKVFDDADVHTAIYLFTKKQNDESNNEVLMTTDLEGILMV
jgi:adenine-specific DNA-methyltransferase